MGYDVHWPLIEVELRRCKKTGIILGDLLFSFDSDKPKARTWVRDVMILYEKKGRVVEAGMTDGEYGIPDDISGEHFDRLQEIGKIYGKNYPDWEVYEDEETKDPLPKAVREFLASEKRPPKNDPSLLPTRTK